MANSRQRLVLFDGTKNVKTMNPWNVDDNTGWTLLTGNDSVMKGYLVPTMFAAQSLYGKSMADLPFCLYNERGDEVDNSDDYQNVTGAMPDPFKFLWLSGASLFTYGASYWYKAKGRVTGNTRDLQYFIPSTVTPRFDDATAQLLWFERKLKQYKPEDMLYTWWYDPTVEDGPPNAYPFRSAALAAGITETMFLWLTDFLERGATKATLLAVKGPLAPDERERVETYWNKFMGGLKNIGKWRIFNADTITPTIIGDGLADLKNVTITQDTQKEILIAAGIPASMILANAANYATAQQDARTFYSNTIMPIARILQGTLNNQLFNKYGVTLQFEPERLEVFQKDEAEKMTSVASLLDAVNKAEPPVVLWAMDVIGYDLTEEQRDALLALQKEDEPEPPAPVMPEAQPAEMEEMPEDEPDEDDQPVMKVYDIDVVIAGLHELEVCEDKAHKALKRGELDEFKFAFYETPDPVCLVVERQLLGVTDDAGIKAAMDEARRVLKYTEIQPAPSPVVVDYSPLMAGIEAALKALEITDKPQPAPQTFNINVAPADVKAEFTMPSNQPMITVQVPDQPAPVVNVTSAPAVVNVAQPPAAVNVKVSAPTPEEVDIIRNNEMLATKFRKVK